MNSSDVIPSLLRGSWRDNFSGVSVLWYVDIACACHGFPKPWHQTTSKLQNFCCDGQDQRWNGKNAYLTDLCWCCMVQAGDWCHTHIKFRICNEALSGACIFHCCAVIFVGWLDPPRVCFALAAGNHAFPAGRPDLGLLGETVNYVAFTRRRFYTQKLLHTEAFTQTLLHKEAFTHRRFYTKKLLRTDAFTHRRLHTHTVAFTHKRVYTQTHRHFCTQKLLHTDAFTH